MAKKQINILAMDGGGIRGIFPSMILAEIEKRTGKPICDLFDIMSGTSTGGIIAVGLTVPGATPGKPKLSAADLAELYEKRGNEIFKQSWLQKIGSIKDNAFSHEGLEHLLNEYFGNARLSQALTQVLVTSYDIEGRTTFYFNSRLAQTQSEEDFLVREVARATSAAPTYFEPLLLHTGDKRRALVDGGVFANNPAMLAYVEAKKQYETAKFAPAGQTASKDAGTSVSAARDIEEPFFMLSLGTGSSRKPYVYEDAKDWGLVGWMRPIIDILMQGVSETVHYQMNQLLPHQLDGTPRYVRLDTTIDAAHSDMADPSEENINGLKRYAQEVIDKKSDTIDMVCDILTQSR